jgi:hypothetical protein
MYQNYLVLDMSLPEFVKEFERNITNKGIFTFDQPHKHKTSTTTVLKATKQALQQY